MGRNRIDGRAARHVAALFLMSAPIAAACSCGEPKPPPCQAAWQYTAVFVGTVNQVSTIEVKGEWNPVRVRFAVEQPLIGMDGRGNDFTIRTGRGGGDCGYHFEVGHTYLVYADQLEDGTLGANSCSRTRPIGEAAGDLAYFRALETAPPRAEFLGTVFDVKLNAGRNGARVILQGEGIRRETISDGAGNFRFPDLAAGKYRVTASAPGTSMLYEPPPIEVHAKGCAYVFLPIGTE
jgi:hypothetical protein